MATTPNPHGATLTIQFEASGLPCTLTFGLDSAAELHTKLNSAIAAITAAGGDAPAILRRRTDTEATSAPVATAAPPAEIPEEIRDAWSCVLPFGNNKGRPLGELSDKELTWLSKECRMSDIKAHAKRLMIYRLGAA
jgi:hypothetical protein